VTDFWPNNITFVRKIPEIEVMIDRATVDRVMDAAEIVDVIGDFVSLRRRGADYVACCPFHNEKTPSFHVSPSKGIYKCFGCGKAGNAVTFLKDHEQMTFVEALKYLGRKYGIAVEDIEEDEDAAADRLRHESMLLVSEFAQKFYRDVLYNTRIGQAVGLAYFRDKRGFSDATIEKFGLGYSPDGGGFRAGGGIQMETLAQAALKAGYKKEFLLSTGLCFERGTGGTLADKFYDRVMFPIHSLSGRVIAFGGRTLLTDKSVAKYVNSPETEIYVKNKSLYGIFQAKAAIAKKQKCYLVEGYADVISMSQAGVENVVASSGTSLTSGQIRLIKRFTTDITVMYDGDAAGIKASIRGIDMLLEEGMTVKVVLLPDGQDPDDFARSHTLDEIVSFLDSHETDFIDFKYELLAEGIKKDPIRKASLIREIIHTISIIPDPIARQVYIEQCAGKMDVKQELLAAEVGKERRKYLENVEKEKRREKEREERMRQRGGAVAGPGRAGVQPVGNMSAGGTGGQHESVPYDGEVPPPEADEEGGVLPDYGDVRYDETERGGHEEPGLPSGFNDKDAGVSNEFLAPVERELMYYLMRYGEYDLIFDEDLLYGKKQEEKLTVFQYVSAQMEEDGLEFRNGIYRRMFLLYASESASADRSGGDVSKVQERIQRVFINNADQELSQAALDLIIQKYNITIDKFNKALTPEDNILGRLIPEAVLRYKAKIVDWEYNKTAAELGRMQKEKADFESQMRLMQSLQMYMKMKNRLAGELAKY